jgi:hypothetical protein
MDTPVLVVRSDCNEAVCANGDIPDDIRDELSAARWTWSVVDGYDALLRRISAWMMDDTEPFLRSLFDGSFWELSRHEAVDRVGPIDLLAMKLARDGIAKFVVRRGGFVRRPGSA